MYIIYKNKKARNQAVPLQYLGCMLGHSRLYSDHKHLTAVAQRAL